MIRDYPVVVYGASGYTGRLVVEFLREYNVSFVAAGRSRERIEQGLKYVPGIEGADYKIVEVEHTVEALTELFTGSKVVCNIVGPFARFGLTVVEAAVKAGCHYLDTNGEQEFSIQVDETFGQAFAQAGLVCAPATAYMYTVGEIAARICLETPGIDTLNIRLFTGGIPTIGSIRTINNIVKTKACKLIDHELVEYPEIEVSDIAVPFNDQVFRALNWGGGTHIAFFRHDARVRNCNFKMASDSFELADEIKGLEQLYKEEIRKLPEEEQITALDELAAQVQDEMAPRETRKDVRYLDWCHGIGNNVASSCYILGASTYQITGLLQAYSAMRLTKHIPSASGFKSISEVLGYRTLLGELQSYGYATMKHEAIV